MRRRHRVACRRPAAAIGAAGFVAVMMLVGETSAVFAPTAPRRLGITEGTVRTRLENTYRLLQVSSRTAAVTRAFAGPTP